jgi:hypothetical protein
MPVHDLHDAPRIISDVHDVHFAGDPATDSVRRHLERVLAGAPTRKTWLMTLAAGGAAWGLWRLVRSMRSTPDSQTDQAAGSGAQPASRRS